VKDRELLQLEETWAEPRGFIGWFKCVHHTSIGRRFVITAFIFFLLGGIEAVLMRIQLARPENTFLGPDLYNQIFTMHGTTMMFLFAVPMMEALGVYLVPLMVGARNIAFPRLNAFGYYIYLLGGIFLYVMFFTGTGPDNGWFSYVPLAGPEYGPGKRADVWAQLITFTELSALVVAVSLIVTVFKLRAPGMSLNRIPLFVWAIVVTAFMIVFAMPTVALGSTCLILDRLVGTHFFNPAEGGDVLLWQHLFWFFGHPEVYIIFIPATGIISAILPTFCRRKIFGYTPLVLSLVATGFIAFGLWVHHMFTTGLPRIAQSFFTAASMMIAIPTGAQIFCWIATIWGTRPRLRPPMLFVLGFFFNFLIGGLTGVMLASVSLDQQVHDTFFVVAHLHYVLIGGSVFPLFAGFYYWFPKMAGRMPGDRLGHWNFWLMLIGFNLTFFPMHQLGLKGMPRRVYAYLPGMGWGGLNLLATLGGVIMTAGVALFLINVFLSLRTGEVAGENPWDAATLEWATSSPPPPFNFDSLPIVAGRDALWDMREGHSGSAAPAVVTGVRGDLREVLVTTVLDAEPDHKTLMPDPSIWPFLSAVATSGLFIGSIFTPWAVPVGAVPVTIALIAWFWPTRKEHLERIEAEQDHGRTPAPPAEPVTQGQA